MNSSLHRWCVWTDQKISCSAARVRTSRSCLRRSALKRCSLKGNVTQKHTKEHKRRLSGHTVKYCCLSARVLRWTGNLSEVYSGGGSSSPRDMSRTKRQLTEHKWMNTWLFVSFRSICEMNLEAELFTLQDSNSKLVAALHEANANVEQWKKQLVAYQEETERLRDQVSLHSNSIWRSLYVNFYYS